MAPVWIQTQLADLCACDLGIASAAEERFLLLGLTTRGRLVVVAHTERGADIRIISARLADRAERRDYEEGQP